MCASAGPGAVARSADDEGPGRRPGPSRLAEDRGFEPLRVINPTRFPIVRTRPLSESSAGEDTGAGGAARPRYSGRRPLVRRHLAELPQGRKAARAGGLWRVREGSLTSV